MASGTASPAEITPMLTFRDGNARVCREFETPGRGGELEIGIACRSAAGAWGVEIVVTAPAPMPGAQGYVPASGPGADALDAMLGALGAGPPLDPQAEAALLARRWRE